MLQRIAVFADQLMQTVPARSRVLEVGAGDGALASALVDRGYDVVAIDRVKRSSFPVVVADFETFEPFDDRFDCIVASLVLHHMDDLKMTLEKARAMLRPNGVIAIDDYGWERLDEEIARGRWGDAWKRELLAWRADRATLHRSDVMLQALDKRFIRIAYTDHAYFDDGAGSDTLAFTYFGRRPQ